MKQLKSSKQILNDVKPSENPSKNNIMISGSNFRFEFIGCEVEVVKARNKTILGLVGKIVDETKETVSIKTGSQIRKIFKRGVCLRFGNGSVIDGLKVAVRSFERLKLNSNKNGCGNSKSCLKK